MNSVTLILLTSLCNGLFFAIGLAAGFTLFYASKADGKQWTQKPLKLSRKQVKEQQKEERRRQETTEIMMHNIDVYNGTDEGQRDVTQ